MDKDFLESINQILQELALYGRNEDSTVRQLSDNYKKLSLEQRKYNIQKLTELLKSNNNQIMFLMSIIFYRLPVKEVMEEIEYLLMDRRLSFWIRLNCMYQLKYKAFRENIRFDNCIDDITDYQRKRNIYKLISTEIQKNIRINEYIPIKKREKKIIIITSQLLSREHAPTRKALHICDYFEKLGYKVQFVVFDIKPNDIQTMWMDCNILYNFTEDIGEFKHSIRDKIIDGYNLQIKNYDELKEIQGVIDYIYDLKPEFVFEVGDMTLVGDICNNFTDVVTMALTKNVPVSNSKFIARYFRYTEEENIEFIRKLSENQIVIDVPHVATNMEVLNSKIVYSKEDFGIREAAFLIIISGNRLDVEITEEFLEVLYKIIKIGDNISIMFIGKAESIKVKIKNELKNKFYFLGHVDHFLQAIAVGDLFLNPPRQGGGTGGLYAIKSEVPVITLDNCDVEAIVGKEFVCNSLEDMVNMVEKYYTDNEFMKKQKEICRISSEQWFNCDSIGNFKHLIDVVHENTSENDFM